MNRPTKCCEESRLSPIQPTRRDFVIASTGVAAAAALGSHANANSWKLLHRSDSETLVKQLFDSLTESQRQAICFGFDDPLRSKVDNNWFITNSRISRDFDRDQQDLIRQIFLNLHSEEYAKQVLAQVEHDGIANGGFGGCSIALFGEPGTGKFEFVLTGRHVTRRCDGDSVEGAAFGGPIFYGHAAQSFDEAPDHPENIYWYQAKRANELFAELDEKQRKIALLGDSRGERGTETVKLRGAETRCDGLPASELSADQKNLMRQVLDDVLAPFREVDRAESLKLIEEQGFDQLHIAYFQNEDIGNDRVWDVWQVEGPGTLLYFRGKPHVHTWVHIKKEA